MEIEDLYKRACLDAEELVVKQAAVMQMLAAGKHASLATAAIAVERIIPQCQTAHSMLLCIILGCNAILSAFRPWDASLIDDSNHYCDGVLSLARDVAPYRPLGASHFPICLVPAYLTAHRLPERFCEFFLVGYCCQGQRFVLESSYSICGRYCKSV
jgi:hypothetical protein